MCVSTLYMYTCTHTHTPINVWVCERFARKSLEQVFDALERAERELKTATESLSVVGQQLDELRAVVQDGEARPPQSQHNFGSETNNKFLPTSTGRRWNAKESCLNATALKQLQPPEVAKTSSTTSRDSSPGRVTLSVADPPGLLLHRHNLQKRKNKQAPELNTAQEHVAAVCQPQSDWHVCA